jgi:hypothetical protein
MPSCRINFVEPVSVFMPGIEQPACRSTLILNQVLSTCIRGKEINAHVPFGFVQDTEDVLRKLHGKSRHFRTMCRRETGYGGAGQWRAADRTDGGQEFPRLGLQPFPHLERYYNQGGPGPAKPDLAMC